MGSLLNSVERQRWSSDGAAQALQPVSLSSSNTYVCVEVPVSRAPFPIAECDEEGNWSQGMSLGSAATFAQRDPLVFKIGSVQPSETI